MRLSTAAVRLVLVSILAGSMPTGIVWGAAHQPPKTDAAKIANAMSAAPPAVSRNASVMEMTADGNMKMLRKGAGEWTCIPDDPSSPGNDPMCLDPNAMEWLHAYIGKSPPPAKVGFIYMLQGGWDFSNLDPYANQPDGGKATITGPHVMVVGPAVKAAPGYDRTGTGQHCSSLRNVERYGLRTPDDPGALVSLVSGWAGRAGRSAA